MKTHYKYIDRLKGITMLTVIMGHFIQWSLFIKNDIIADLIFSFHMPLFMFLSGLVISSPPSLNKCITKLVKFFMPLFIVGGIYAIFSQHRTFHNFVFHQMKLGYWYLWTLGIFYICLCFFNISLFKVKECIKDLIFCLLFFLFFLILNKLLPETINNLLSIKQCYGFWTWFAFGYLVNKYNWIDYLMKHNWIYTICLIGFIPLFWLVHYCGLNFYKPMNFCAIVSLLYLFCLRENKATAIDYQLEFIGKKSLDVYIYHYFFIWLFVFKSLGGWLSYTKNYFLEVLLLIFFSTIIAYTTIIVGHIIKKSWLLNQLIYGNYIYKFIHKV